GFADLAVQAGYFERSGFGPFEDEQINLARFGGGAPFPAWDEFAFAFLVRTRVGECASLGPEGGRAGAINGFAIDLHPLAHFGQPLQAWLRDQALACRADIQQVIAAFAGDV